jgi:N-acetylgalactosamine kinase
MDQAISILATRGVAKIVDFNPLRTVDVTLPVGSVFVVANSLTPSAKAETASVRFNARVVESQLAAALLSTHHGMIPKNAARHIKNLLDFENRVRDHGDPRGGTTIDAANLVASLLPEDSYSAADIEAALETPMRIIFEGQPALLAAVEHLTTTGFRLRDRALHVYSEALRVRQFHSLCVETSTSGASTSGASTSEDTLVALGELMDISHKSCQLLYECSCPELDELVVTCKQLGAAGARLTGAGWGGCVVVLLREEQLGEFLPALQQAFYAPRIADGRLRAEDLPSAVFSTVPGNGAAIFRPSQ